MAAKDPKTLEELQQTLFRRGWKWLKDRSPFAKVLLAVVAVSVTALGARLGFLGTSAQSVARAVRPAPLPYLESWRSRPALTLTFDAGRNGTVSPEVKGTLLRSGDDVVLHVTPSADAWTLIFGIDARGRHAVLGRDFHPVLLQGDKTHSIRFRLDTTVGTESYVAVAAADPFTFDDDVAPHISRETLKGPLLQDLPLHERFAQQQIWFSHVAK